MTPVPGTAGLRKTRPARSARDLARDRGVLERHEDQILLGVLDRLADRLRDLVGLAEADADVPAAVAHDDQRREREPPAALDDLGHPVDGDDAVVELQHAGIDLRFRHSDSPDCCMSHVAARLRADQNGPDARRASRPAYAAYAQGREATTQMGHFHRPVRTRGRRRARVGERLHAPWYW
jgi:hypothetical protein